MKEESELYAVDEPQNTVPIEWITMNSQMTFLCQRLKQRVIDLKIQEETLRKSGKAIDRKVFIIEYLLFF